MQSLHAPELPLVASRHTRAQGHCMACQQGVVGSDRRTGTLQSGAHGGGLPSSLGIEGQECDHAQRTSNITTLQFWVACQVHAVFDLEEGHGRDRQGGGRVGHQPPLGLGLPAQMRDEEVGIEQ